MNSRKCYLVVVTSAKTTTRADYSTLSRALHIFTSPWHHTDFTWSLVHHTIFIKLLDKRSTLLLFGLSSKCWGFARCFRCLCYSTYRKCRLILRADFKLLTRSAERGLKRVNVQNNQLFAGKWHPGITPKKYVAVSKITVFLGPDYMANFIPGWNFSPASKTNPLKTKLIVNYMERDSARAEKEREHAHWPCFRTSVNFLTEICVLLHITSVRGTLN